MNIFNFSYFNFNLYSLGERIVRTCVFQTGVEQGMLERSLIWLYQACFEFTCFPNRFDSKRAEQTLNAFIQLGAEVEFVMPKDGQANIQVMKLCSSDLEEKLQTFGATWDKLTVLEL